MLLAWVFSGDEITFTLTVPSSVVSSYDWWGFGVGASGMAGSDIITIDKASGTITDRKASGRTLPPADASQDVTKIGHGESGGNWATSFKRKKVTGDSNDNDIAEGASLSVIWAMGTGAGGNIN
jgi:hypothetical protein